MSAHLDSVLRHTRDNYQRPRVRKFFDRANVSPGRVTSEHVRAFLVHVVDERRLSCAGHDVYIRVR